MATWLGRYRLSSRLGAGTVGEVFRAKIFGVEGFEKALAVKRLLPELGAHPPVAEAFAAAAQDALRLSHANVVQVLDVGRTDAPGAPSFYLAMELVAGVDLATLLGTLRARGRDVPLGLVPFVGAEIAKAIDHAHRRRDDKGRPLGLVHGGLGPTNVLLSWEGEVKVADFGLARALAVAPPSEVVTAARARRSAYESPEQAAGGAGTARADLYALGAILHEVLAGALPLGGGTAPGVPATVPEELADVVARLLAASPDDRPRDAGAVHDELLGYAYASGDRFGAADLAALLAGLAKDEGAPSIDDAALLEEDEPTTALEGASAREVAVLVLTGPAGDATEAAVEGLDAPIVTRAADEIAAVVPLEGGGGRAVRAALAHVGPRADADRAAGLAAGAVPLGADGGYERGPALDALLETSRALAHTAGGHVVASSHAIQACGPAVATDELPGPSSPDADARVVVGARDLGDHRDRFVGRRRELRRLGEALAHATAGHARVVTITGPSGVGKTRLVDEALRRLEKGGHDVGVARAACPTGDAATPWSGALALLGALAGVRDGADGARHHEASARLRALGMTASESDAVLGALAAPAIAVRDAGAIGASFTRALCRLCEDRPHVFAWDAAESLDAATAGALAALVAGRDRLRALALLASRDGQNAVLAGGDHVVVVDLPALDADETAELVAARLGARVVPSPLLESLRARTGGHPRALEAAIADLVASGAVSVDAGVASLRPA